LIFLEPDFTFGQIIPLGAQSDRGKWQPQLLQAPDGRLADAQCAADLLAIHFADHHGFASDFPSLTQKNCTPPQTGQTKLCAPSQSLDWIRAFCACVPVQLHLILPHFQIVVMMHS
jgi:hypothetical protein